MEVVYKLASRFVRELVSKLARRAYDPRYEVRIRSRREIPTESIIKTTWRVLVWRLVHDMLVERRMGSLCVVFLAVAQFGKWGHYCDFGNSWKLCFELLRLWTSVGFLDSVAFLWGWI